MVKHVDINEFYIQYTVEYCGWMREQEIAVFYFHMILVRIFISLKTSKEYSKEIHML